MSKKKFELPPDIELSEEAKKGMAALSDFINTQLEEIEKGNTTPKEMDEQVKKMLDDFASSKAQIEQLKEAMKAQGIDIKVLKEGNGAIGKVKSISDVCRELWTKENIEAVKRAEGTPYMATLTTKAVDTIMTTPNVNPNAPMALSFEVVPGVDSKPLPPPAILDALNKVGTTSKTIYWINRIDKDGGSAFIDEGGLKPLMDWEYTQESSQAKKIAVSTKFSTEMLEDFAASDFEAEVRMMLSTDLYNELDEKLLNGVGGTTEPVGITTVASTYLGTGLDGKVRLPNNADAIRACMLQMSQLEYTPNIVFMHPADLASIELEKTTDGNYIRLQVENVIRGLRVIPTTRIPYGKFLLMDGSRWIIRVLSDFRLAFGWENDDFRRNLVTVIAEMRLHSYHNSIHVGAIIFEEYDIVKALIEAP